MPTFPTREAEVTVLANSMVAGYTAHPTVFPGADTVGLQAAFDAYFAAKTAQTDAQAQAQLATEAKEGGREALEVEMKNQLKQSEVDTAGDSGQLELIGWGPKAPAQPSDPPGQPRALDPAIQGAGTVFLDWKAPATGTGGKVRTYLVERREQPAGGGAFGDWQQVGIALETESHLVGQPRNVQLEYRIIAVNVGGNSVPSNTAPVVL